MPLCLIALGSNVGDRKAQLDEAIALLSRHRALDVVAVSRWHETAAVGGPPGQLPFLNGAAVVQTELAPRALLGALLAAEAQLGRRRHGRWEARSIDLDLLLYGETILRTGELEIPHPRMAWRGFVLTPAAEVAAGMVHPTSGWTVGRLAEHLATAKPYVAITGAVGAGKRLLARRLASTLGGELVLDCVQPGQGFLNRGLPAGSAAEEELECAACRRRLLDAAVALWKAAPWVVSDFWIEQGLALAQTFLPDEAMLPWAGRFGAAIDGAVEPKLLVVLTAQAVSEATSRPQDSPRASLGQASLGVAVQQRAQRPGHGPVLVAPAGDAETAFGEVVAAVESMRP